MRDMVLRTLLAANPWATPWLEHWARGATIADCFDDPAFMAARGCASWDRLGGAVSDWDAWAAACREAVEAAASEDGADRLVADALGAADFRRPREAGRIDLAGRSCPGDVWIGEGGDDGVASEELWFDAAEIAGDLVIAGAVSGITSLQALRLGGALSIDGARFGDRFEATKLSVGGACAVSDAAFAREAWFRDARFAGPARFDGCAFAADAGFLGATFTASAVFAHCRFNGNLGLERVRFDGPAEFHALAPPRKVFAAGAQFARHRDELAVARLNEPAPTASNVTRLSDYRKRRLGA